MMGGMGHHEQDQSHYPLVNIQKAIEHGHGNSGFSLLENGWIVHSYVSLPEGNGCSYGWG